MQSRYVGRCDSCGHELYDGDLRYNVRLGNVDLELCDRCVELLPTPYDPYHDGLWDALEEISSVWNGKQRFFREDDGRVYDRNMCDWLDCVEDAISRFTHENSAFEQEM